ncbi:serine/threonine protein kinase [Fusarium austroafricanum]|uniref:Serine/threonine protein kinase n=1 Tax=Fusarium austroafricanum TaxID=2364996 RepID=A0A8H4KFK7_9HYPO|nr:serine/threonine protein kinase [Fusarium austroafricanum]
MPGSYIPPVDRTATQHDGTEHLAINNTLFRRLVTRLALKTTAHFYKYDEPCAPISKRLIVKTGPAVHLTEAATMRFVAANTSIPVPSIYCSFIHKNRAFIVMERIQGISLPAAWRTLSETDRKNIFNQLRGYFDELRALTPPPGTGVESCEGGSLRDSRIPRSWPRFGPFKTIQDFHSWLREDLKPEEHPDREDDDDWRAIKEMVVKQDGPWPSPVFTHGDLNPSNIMVRGDRVVGIIDWEFGGWYPYYWEYTSAWYGNRLRQEWQQLITEFLDAYPAELEMDKTRQRWWGDF